MIKLKKTNGEISIGNNLISPCSSIEDLREFGAAELIIRNVDYETYSISGIEHGEIQLLAIFFMHKLKSIHIQLGEKYQTVPFLITTEDRKNIAIMLEEIGGENNYSWGRVSLNEDKKGGVLSIVISYK